MAKETVEQLKNRLRKVKIGDRTYRLAEGDLLLEEHQLANYVPANDPPAMPVATQKELVGIIENGQIVRWRPGVVLSYCILDGFTAAEHAAIAAQMLQATQDWEATCGVQFRHLSQHDGEPTKHHDALFAVRKVDAGGEFIAAAFFPNDAPDRREVVIDPRHFTQTTFDRVGVLRHELGHVLGFRHEHIRPEAPAMCPREDLTVTINLNDYDPHSVMHYFCGGVGSRELAITSTDRVAAQTLYGLPLASLRFCD